MEESTQVPRDIWHRVMAWLRESWLQLRVFVAVLSIVRFSLLIPMILIVTLIAADQMIDLLRALGEDQEGVAVVWLLSTSAFAGLTVWYSARTMLRFRFASNPASDRKVHPRLKRWLPGILGVAIPASLTIRVALLAYISTHAKGLWYFALALVAITGAVAFYIFQRHNLARRTGLHLLAEEEGTEARNLERWRELQPTTKKVFYTLLAINVLFLACFSWDAFYQIGAPAKLGASAILLLGLGLTTVIGSALVYMGNHYSMPVLRLLAAWVVLCSINNDNHAVRETLQSGSHGFLTRPDMPAPGSLAQSPLGNLTASDYFQDWWRDLQHDVAESNGPIPVFVVAAEGGGMRAAYWTAAVMGALEEATGKSPTPFSRHVFAISGVSGGSVGAAIFDIALANRTRNSQLQRQADNQNWVDEMDGVLGKDFLSDTLGNALFPDLLQRFLPAPILNDRAIALEHSFERTWSTMHPREQLQLTSSFHDLWRDNPHMVPLLFFNSTVVETGQRAINSPLATSPITVDTTFADVLPLGRQIGTELPLSTAALLSARFTYVSPAGLINTHPEETNRADLPTWMRIVDGGYFDNSGAVTAQELARAIIAARSRYKNEHPSEPQRPMQVIVLHLPNSPLQPSADLNAQQRASSGHKWMSELLAPLNSLLNTRSARGTQAVSYLKGEPNVKLLTIRPQITRVAAPLGWVLSGQVRDEMRRQLDCDTASDNSATTPLCWVERLINTGAADDPPVTGANVSAIL